MSQVNKYANKAGYTADKNRALLTIAGPAKGPDVAAALLAVAEHLAPLRVLWSELHD